jgi:hypothetical protein
VNVKQKLDFSSSSVGNSNRGKEIYCINNSSTIKLKITAGYKSGYLPKLQ